MAKEHSIEEMRALLTTTAPVYLATVDAEGYPHVRAMFNLHNLEQWPELEEFMAPAREEFVAYFSTNTSSPKVAHVRANPKAAAYYCDGEQYHGLMLRGTVEVVDDRAVKEALWYDESKKYYPQGPDDPDYTVLRFRPTSAKYYRNLAVTALELPEVK